MMKNINFEKIVTLVAALAVILSLTMELIGHGKNDVDGGSAFALAVMIVFVSMSVLTIYFTFTSKKTITHKFSWLSVYLACIVVTLPFLQQQIILYISHTTVLAIIVYALLLMRSSE